MTAPYCDQPAEYADEHANEDDSDGGEEDVPPGHIQGHLIRPDHQGDATYSLTNLLNSLVLAIRSAIPLLDQSNAFAIVASPHLFTILLNHQS